MMQIKSIILYNADGVPREIPFALNKVNLITGDSHTGKSALIPIINYCLELSDYGIPERIKNIVSWFAVLYQIADIQVLVAKPNPNSNHKISSGFYKEGKNINIPSYQELENQSLKNDFYINKDLSTLLRNSLNLLTENYHQIDNFNLTLDHAIYYLFLPKDIIDSGKTLFYHQDNASCVKRIKETLPYFIGAKTENEFLLQQQYDEKIKKLSTIKNDLKNYESAMKRNDEKIKDFFITAQSLNLMANNLITQTMNSNQILEFLKNIIDIPFNSTPLAPELKDIEPELRQELQRLNDELTEIVLKINSIQSYNQDIKNYKSEADEHLMRLQSIELFKATSLLSDEKKCPLCESELKQVLPSITEIQNSLKQLEKNLTFINRDDINIDNEKIKLEQLKEEKRAAIGKIEEKLRKIFTEKKKHKDFFDQEILKQRNIGEFIGAVKEFFKENQLNNNEKWLEEKKILERDLELLSNKINEYKDGLNIQLRQLDDKINEFSNRIYLNQQEDYYSFSLNQLKIIVSNKSFPKPISMENLGSSLNYLGCHLITLLALHYFFDKEKSPVPNFLVLDQPIQGYLSDNKNDDTDKIKEMIKLMLNVCEEIGLQIILIEHEQNFPMEDKLYRVEKHWTAENALIPKHWIKS